MASEPPFTEQPKLGITDLGGESHKEIDCIRKEEGRYCWRGKAFPLPSLVK